MEGIDHGRSLRVVPSLLTERSRHEAAAPLLSARQGECLRLIAIGHNIAEAGRSMSVSERTAKRHLEEAKARLGARSNAHAVSLALGLGLLAFD